MAIAIVSTGGTIASTENTGDDATPELTGNDLVSAVPELGELTTVKSWEFSNVPSPHFTIKQMYELVELIRELNTCDSIDGIVVTQGTDILEESAFFVDLCYGGDAPVVFTGALRNPSLLSPDGPANLLASSRVAIDRTDRTDNVYVVFNDRIHPAVDVTKMHTMNVDTFRTPEFGPLGVVVEDTVVWMRDRQHEWPILNPNPNHLSNDVSAVLITADMNDRVLKMDDAEPTALCIAATGAGHIPPSIIPTLEMYRERDIPIIATTRCPEGFLAQQTYGFRGSEATLQELGCFFSPLNLQKTRIATIIAMATNALDAMFDQPTTS